MRAPAFSLHLGESHEVNPLQAHDVRMRFRSRADTMAPVGPGAPVGYVTVSDRVRSSSVLLKEEET